MKTFQQITMAIAVAAIVGVAAGPAAAKHGSTVNSKASLASSGVDDNAAGLAKLQVKNNTDGRFDIQVKKLDRNTTYDVLVNGVHVGTIKTTGGGAGKIRFRSRPRNSKDVLLGFDPRGAVVTIVSAAGETVLTVTLPDGTPDDAGKIVCCVPDDSGTECEDRTADECTAQGGTVSTATSCLPNPCADVPPAPGGDVVCCIPDDSGAECEDRTSAECAAQGGVVVTATSCSPDPCAPVVPPAADIQCCRPDDGAFECEDRTPGECAAQGGTNVGDGVCTPDACAGLTPPANGDDNGGANEPGDDNGGGGEAGDDGGHGGHGGHGGDDGAGHH